MDHPVRVRFAPSPTGPLHIGGVRTALYNFLFAKKHKGVFIIRIEDTDQSRLVPEAEKYIYESLAWLGIIPDESPVAGGPFAPYCQSQRKNIYQSYVGQLVDSGHAYYAFDTEEDLNRMRDANTQGKNSFLYNHVTRERMKNSLSLPEKEWLKLIDSGAPYVIRIKVPEKEEVRLKDEIRGWVIVNSSTLDDKILLKSDGMPTYHLAHLVDDHLMEITHVIRGEEWLPSAPLHVLLYKYFGWIDSMPRFAHLPLLLKPEGTGKLSKRDADKGGFPIFPVNWKDPASGEISIGFRERGYLPEAMVNFLALLGWNPGTEQEMFPMEELIEAFSMEKVNKSGARFDIGKAVFFNQQYIRKKPTKDFEPLVRKKLEEHNLKTDPSRLHIIMEAMKDRITFPEEFFTKAEYFFSRPQHIETQAISKKYDGKSEAALNHIAAKLNAHQGPLAGNGFREIVEQAAGEYDIQPGQILSPLRIMVTGTTTGIDLMKTLELLGPGEVSARIIAGVSLMARKG